MAIWYRPDATRSEWVQRRKSGRKPVQQVAVLKALDSEAVLGECTILDVSQEGARLAVTRPSDLPDAFILVLSRNAQVFRRCSVKWRSKSQVGVQFDH